MVFNSKKPYDDIPALPPTQDVESKSVLKQCLGASRALAELKGVGGLIPDQTILINAIPLQEAKLSSEIENIVTTQDELFKAALDENNITSPEVKEVLRYRTALRFGYEYLIEHPLNLGLIRDVCSVLLGTPVHFRTLDEQVFIGNPLTGHVIYSPPKGGKALEKKLINLEKFLLDKSGPDPLIRMAIVHYQFEALHPFTDGNGRTGRILNILYLLHAGLLSIPVLYLSRYIIKFKNDYYRLLREVTENDNWEPWLLYILHGIQETAIWTTERIEAIKDLFNNTVELCRKEAPTIYSNELIEMIFRQPYSKISFLVEAGIAKRQTASVYLQKLEQIGILKGEKRGREVIYKHPALLEVLIE